MVKTKQLLFSALQSIFQDRLFDQDVMQEIVANNDFAEQLNQVLHNHNLAARAYRIHSTNSNDLKNKAFWGDLEKAYLTSMQSTNMFLSLANQLKSNFEKNNIEYAFIKGPVLAQRIYHHPYDRVFHDLDLFIPKASSKEVIKLLEGLGYVLQNRGGKFYANKDKLEFFFQDDPKLCVEVHFALGYEKYQVTPQIFIDKKSGFPVIDEIHDFQFLLFHAGVQHRFQKLTWLLDLALFEDHFKTQASKVFEQLNNSSHPLHRCYGIMTTILNFYKHASPCELPPDWVSALIDEGDLSKWQIAALRMKIQGRGPFMKYMMHRFLGKFDRAGH
jgi:hypothetical protein